MMNAAFHRELITHPYTRPAVRRYVGPGYIIPDGKVKAVVIHWTANRQKGADARRHRNYFNNGSPGTGGSHRLASAHFAVDDHSVYWCIPCNEVAFHCGDKPLGKYKPAGIKLIHREQKTTPNYFTVGVEMCVNSDGDFDRTAENTKYLAALLLKQHGLTADNLLRHYDITGKDCPKMLLDEEDWFLFRTGVLRNTAEHFADYRRGVVSSDQLNVRGGPGTQHSVLYTLNRGEAVAHGQLEGNWAPVGFGGWVNTKYISH